MNEALRIYIDRLRTQGTEPIQETVPPDFIGIQEEGLTFIDPVTLSGEAYLAHDELVVKLIIATVARMPCAICNQQIEVPIHTELMHVQPLKELKRAVLDMSQLVREAIVLEVPLVAECSKGNCPGRKEIEAYLKEKKKSDAGAGKEFRPFADLDRGEQES